jgi:hypothetical protein
MINTVVADLSWACTAPLASWLTTSALVEPDTASLSTVAFLPVPAPTIAA